MASRQMTIYDAIRRRELQEAEAEEEAAFTGPAQARLCPECGEPLTPKGWCPCEALARVQEVVH